MIRFFRTHRFLGGLALVLYVGLMLFCYLWNQNGFNVLATQKAALNREVSSLRGEVVLKELENREFSSLERISEVAKRLGIGYAQIPRKVKRVGGLQ